MAMPEDPGIVNSADVRAAARRGHRSFVLRGWLLILLCALVSAALLVGVQRLHNVAHTDRAWTGDGAAASGRTTTSHDSGPSAGPESSSGVQSSPPRSTVVTGQEPLDPTTLPQLTTPPVTDPSEVDGGTSVPTAANEPPEQPPTVPVAIEVGWDDPAEPTAVQISFQPGSGGGKLTGFEVWSDNGSHANLGEAEFFWKDETGTPKRQYRIRAVGDGGVSEFSAPTSAGLPLPPGTPENLRCDFKNGSMVVAWDLAPLGRVDRLDIAREGGFLESVKPDDRSYRDATFDGEHQTYVVRAVGPFDQRSVSDPVSCPQTPG
jgi:hypothetical protein